MAEVEANYNDPFAPRKGGSRVVRCLHCGGIYNEGEMKYESRKGGPKMWWCKNDFCDGRGVGFDIHTIPGGWVDREYKCSVCGEKHMVTELGLVFATVADDVLYAFCENCINRVYTKPHHRTDNYDLEYMLGDDND